MPSLNAAKRQSVISVQPGGGGGGGLDDTYSSTSMHAQPPMSSHHVDSLRTVHSRQASSSSCTSSVGNLGSPKPEKRQANSPLPPTPKTANSSTAASSGSGSSGNNLNANSIGSSGFGSSVPSSSRNSVASVIECQQQLGHSRHVSRENLSGSDGGGLLSVQTRSQSRLSVVSMTAADGSKHEDDGGPAKKRNSAKNLEGMYAKVSVFVVL